ncbi:MAG: ester cyclase [Anaerolineae bacterium]
MSVDENKAVVRRAIEEIWNGSNPQAAVDLLAPDVLYHHGSLPMPLQGRDALVSVMLANRMIFPDRRVTTDDLFAEDDRVAWRGVAFGTHQGGAVFGIQPSGAQTAVSGMGIFRLVDGRIAEVWLEDNLVGLVLQLGGYVGAPPGNV